MEVIKIASERFFEGLRALNDGNLNLAEMKFLKALELTPDRPSILTNLSVVYTQQNKLLQALDLVRKALEKDSNEPLYWLQNGAVQLKLRDYDGALSSLTRALEKNPYLAEAHNNLGGVLKELNRLDEALASYDKAISLKPDYAEAYSNRGNTLKDLDRLDEALAGYDKAISLKPDFAEAYSNRGNTLKDLDRLDEALASYDKAISLKPDYAEAYSNRGNTLKDLYRLDEALASYDKAISLKPDYAQAYCGKGWWYYRIEDWTNASVNFVAALHREPTSNSAMSGLSLLPLGMVSPDRIKECLEVEANEWKDGAIYLFTRANLLFSLGDYAKAFDALEKANQKRVTDGNLKSKSWREQFDRISLELTSWKPVQLKNSSSHKKLLVILGPSRSGKTTLERILCNDHSFFRGFEGCRASPAVKSLRKLAEETRQNPKDENDIASVLWEILFPTHVEALDRPEYRLHTITNPFLLPAVPAIADVYEGAYFIFVGRNRIDNAAEIFAKDYADKPSYAYQAVTALEYVDRYCEMSKQLSIKLGNRAIEISFDQIIQSPTKVLNDVYAFVGLKPSPGVIDGVVPTQNRTSASPFRVQFAELLSGRSHSRGIPFGA